MIGPMIGSGLMIGTTSGKLWSPGGPEATISGKLCREPVGASRCPRGMTTRRSLLVGAALAGAAGVLAACEPGPSGPARRSSGVPDLLLADGTAGLIMVRGTASHLVGPGAYAPDAATVYVTIADGDSDTVLETLDTASGQTRGRVGLPGRWTPRITSPNGGLVALTAPGEARSASGEAGRVGREQTTIMVADWTGER